MSRIDVAITIDTEFSLGGVFHARGGRPVGDQRVHCTIAGRDWGLGNLLGVFSAHGLKATFFIETLHTAYFGDAPMGAVVERILAAGHDVQLHLHPAWLAFRERDWRTLARKCPPSDDCAGRSEGELCGMIGLGLETFQRWGAPVPVALRTGSLRVDRTVYRAMAKMGLRVASNVGWGYFEPAEEELRLAGGRRWIEGVLELPVVTYRQMSIGPLKPLRLCTITSTSKAEMIRLLRQAATNRVSPFVILTHPFEFVRYFGGVEPAAPSWTNLSRLGALCGFLASHRESFRTVTFAAGSAEWSALPPQSFPPMRVPALATAARVVENKLNDMRFWA